MLRHAFYHDGDSFCVLNFCVLRVARSVSGATALVATVGGRTKGFSDVEFACCSEWGFVRGGDSLCRPND